MKKLLIFAFSLLLLTLNSSAFAQDNKVQYENAITENGYEYSEKGFATAISYGDYVVVDNFLKSGYDANLKINGLPSTFYAVLKQKQTTLEQLLQAGANPDVTWGKLSLLLFTIEQNNPYLTEIVIEHNADINKSVYGISPLNYALMKKNSEIAKILLSSGAVPDKASLKYVKKTKNSELFELVQKSYDEHNNYFKK